MLGQRGPRAAREQRANAARWFIGFASGGLLLGAAGIVSMEAQVRATLAVPAALAFVLAGVLLLGCEHTAGGEILAAVALSSTAWPVAAAAGARSKSAVTCAAVFAAGFVASTMGVRAVIARTRRPPAIGAGVSAAVVAVGVVAALVLLARAQIVDDIAPWTSVPLCAGGVLVALTTRSARHLRRVGWTLVVTTGLTAVVLIGGLR